MPKNFLTAVSRLQLAARLAEALEENERLKIMLHEANEKLARQELVCKEKGSLAQAALELSGIFEAAQKAADLYLQNVKNEGGDLVETVQ